MALIEPRVAFLFSGPGKNMASFSSGHPVTVLRNLFGSMGNSLTSLAGGLEGLQNASPNKGVDGLSSPPARRLAFLQ